MNTAKTWLSVGLSVLMTLLLLAIIPYLQSAATQRQQDEDPNTVPVVSFTPAQVIPEERSAPAVSSAEVETPIELQTPVAIPSPSIFTETAPSAIEWTIPTEKTALASWEWIANSDLDIVEQAKPTMVGQGQELKELTQGMSVNVTKVEPSIIYRTETPMPTLAKLRGIQGSAEVEFTVDLDGRPSQVRIVSAEPELFGPPALESVKKWRFKPGSIDGKVSPMTMKQTFIFSP